MFALSYAPFREYKRPPSYYAFCQETKYMFFFYIWFKVIKYCIFKSKTYIFPYISRNKKLEHCGILIPSTHGMKNISRNFQWYFKTTPVNSCEMKSITHNKKKIVLRSTSMPLSKVQYLK